MSSQPLTPPRSRIGSTEGALVVMVPLLLWSYWPTLVGLSQRWAHDPQYSHGYLVPLFSLFLLWHRREQLRKLNPSPSWWGLVWLALALAIRLIGAYFYLPLLDALSLLPCLAGLCVLLGGTRSLHWSWPALAFLLFMLPLPYRVQVALALPLQRVATRASTYILQTVGFPALAEGNIIVFNEVKVGVVEACNGLSMLVTFFALTTAVAIVMRGNWVYKVVAVLSALPIALVVNIVRIVATAILYNAFGKEVAHVVFHDLAGWLMMPAALLLVAMELWLLKRLLVEVDRELTHSVRLTLLGKAVPVREDLR